MTTVHKTVMNINTVADKVGGRRLKDSDIELIPGGNAVRL